MGTGIQDKLFKEDDNGSVKLNGYASSQKFCKTYEFKEYLKSQLGLDDILIQDVDELNKTKDNDYVRFVMKLDKVSSYLSDPIDLNKNYMVRNVIRDLRCETTQTYRQENESKPLPKKYMVSSRSNRSIYALSTLSGKLQNIDNEMRKEWLQEMPRDKKIAFVDKQVDKYAFDLHTIKVDDLDDVRLQAIATIVDDWNRYEDKTTDRGWWRDVSQSALDLLSGFHKNPDGGGSVNKQIDDYGF